MKHKIRVRVPVEKRGWFGRTKTVYEDRVLVVDNRTYRQIREAQEEAELDDFLDFMEEMEAVDELFEEA